MRNKKRYIVKIKNFETGEYETMRLQYDSRVNRDGLAIYQTKKEAQICRGIAVALSGAFIKTRIEEEDEKE